MKKWTLSSVPAVFLAAVMILSAVLSVCAAGVEYPVREGDYTESPRDGSIVVGIEGTYVTIDEQAKATILERINEIRKEACDERLPYPGDRSRNLKPSDYVPIKWSGVIEMIAAMRAVEASMCIAHQRLAKGHTSVWDNNYGIFTNAENLAWNWSDPTTDAIIYGINQWYSEKEDWINNTAGAVTGHYTSMINPGMKYIGLSGFSNPFAKYSMTVTNQMSVAENLDESVAGIGGNVTQKIEIDPEYVEEIKIKGDDVVKTGQSIDLTARAKVTVGTSSGCGPVFTGITWRCGNPSVASVDDNGRVTGLSAGDATITATLPNGKSASVAVTVKQASEYTDEKLYFSAVSVTLQSDFSINFKTEEYYLRLAGYDGFYCLFRVNGDEIKVTDFTNKNGKIIFTFNDIAPDKLVDTVTATLFATKRGKEYEGASVKYSVCDYCYKLLDKNKSEYLNKLLVNMLDFAAASQKYTGYKTDDLANAKLTAEQKAYGSSGSISFRDSKNTSYRTVDSPSVNWEGAGLSLADSVCIRYRLTTNSIRGLTFNVRDDDGHEWTYGESDLVAADEGGYYLFFDGLVADQMRIPFYVTAYRNGEMTSNTMKYSVESYAYAVYKQYGYNDVLRLLAAMLNYGDAAAAYVGNR